MTIPWLRLQTRDTVPQSVTYKIIEFAIPEYPHTILDRFNDDVCKEIKRCHDEAQSASVPCAVAGTQRGVSSGPRDKKH